MRIGLTFDLKSTAAGALDGPPLSDDWDEEFDAPETIAALAETIRSLGHEVELIGDGEPALRRLLEPPRPDLVFNIAEGLGAGRCREARLPALLEMLGIPYTGSDPLTLAVTLDKDCAKRLIRDAGIATPAWALVASDLVESDLADIESRLPGLAWPVIVKPACEGSSKGVRAASLVHSADELRQTLAETLRVYRQPVLVEEFIDGAELTVGVVGNTPPRVLGIMRVVPRDSAGPFVYGLEVKRDWRRRVTYECPAQLPPAELRAVEEAALGVWRALGCRDVARIDFRLRDGVPYFLEVNPLPGISPVYSDLTILAQGMGVEHRDLIGRILDAAIQRTANQGAAIQGGAFEGPATTQSTGALCGS